jgi:hypothetical protein
VFVPNDQEALAKANQHIEIDGRAVELWSGTSLIARIDPPKNLMDNINPP